MYADKKRSEWLTHQHRDTLASIVGHPTLTSYMAIADGEAIGRVKFEMTEVRSNVVSTSATHVDYAYSACCNLAGRLLPRTTEETLRRGQQSPTSDWIPVRHVA